MGFIGRHLAYHLNLSGYSVSGLGYGAWTLRDASQWGFSYWLDGQVNFSNLVRLAREWGTPAVVFHLAGGSSVGGALVNPMQDFQRTVVSTSELLEWLRIHANATSLVAVSSAAVYGTEASGLIPETAPTRPFSIYGAHKLMMENLCRFYATNYKLKIVLPRLFSVYGPGLKKQLIWDICEKLSEKNSVELGGTGEELRDWIGVRDVVSFLHCVSKIATTEAPNINIASGQGHTVKEVALMVAKSWAASGVSLPEVRFSGCARPGDPFSLVADVNQMRSLDFSVTIQISQGIDDYVAWYRSLHQIA